MANTRPNIDTKATKAASQPTKPATSGGDWGGRGGQLKPRITGKRKKV